ncbi:enoyl-CoA hydratase-related protein [Variovorax sp. J22P168]|uniref:enoyl-CoA hydratase-related protein n=1 Tax=Variovorax jilinensis TaxID=3053513 RepID=UPI00257821B6|nr:enoyl-CoA hydratase-related protein [Variovorax sp. J22P168]MDM0014043.1 enoyl-CoA hydratase-related protein [Variovorax sp. J22P168]
MQIQADSPSAPVRVEIGEHIMTITLNRPEARNSINLATAICVGDALEKAEYDPAIRVVIITGAGALAFCSGADLKALSRGESIMPEDPERAPWGFAGFVRHAISKPVIAAVNGVAVGGGTEIVLASDLVIASDNASFGLPEVRRGIIAAAGGAFRILKSMPKAAAMEMLLTGEPIDAQRALALGLVNRVVPAAQLQAAARALATRIAENAPLAVQASKRVALGIHYGLIESEQAAWALNHEEITALLRSADAKEGPLAFAERRAPRWASR